MKIRTTMLAASLFAFAFAAACSNSDNDSTGGTPDPSQNDDGNTATTREALKFVAPCAASACGEVPSSSKSTKPTCAQAASGSCSWSDTDPNGTVSYRPCADSECGTKPDASVCPSGTTFKGAQCGSENEGACTWTSACVPPPSTTPCPDADGCGPQPAIGVICADGGSGGLECMKQGTKCVWQRTCE